MNCPIQLLGNFLGLVGPTWPEQALRANIHAQISLALNRVYTEWYRSKGYNFQITSSTSYDQYYVHGRNIFEVLRETPPPSAPCATKFSACRLSAS